MPHTSPPAVKITTAPQPSWPKQVFLICKCAVLCISFCHGIISCTTSIYFIGGAYEDNIDRRRERRACHALHCIAALFERIFFRHLLFGTRGRHRTPPCRDERDKVSSRQCGQVRPLVKAVRTQNSMLAFACGLANEKIAQRIAPRRPVRKGRLCLPAGRTCRAFTQNTGRLSRVRLFTRACQQGNITFCRMHIDLLRGYGGKAKSLCRQPGTSRADSSRPAKGEANLRFFAHGARCALCGRLGRRRGDQPRR